MSFPEDWHRARLTTSGRTLSCAHGCLLALALITIGASGASAQVNGRGGDSNGGSRGSYSGSGGDGPSHGSRRDWLLDGMPGGMVFHPFRRRPPVVYGPARPAYEDVPVYADVPVDRYRQRPRRVYEPTYTDIPVDEEPPIERYRPKPRRVYEPTYTDIPVDGQGPVNRSKPAPRRVYVPPPTIPPKPTLAVRPPPRPVIGVAANPSQVPDEVLFELKGNGAPAVIGAIQRQYRLSTLRSDRIVLLNTTIYRMRVLGQGRNVPDVVRALRADTRIASVQGNAIFRLQDDKGAAAGGGLQWAASKLQLAEAHKVSQGADILVAVVDSGIDVNHPELAGGQVQLVDMIETPFKPNQHGTAMAGAILSHAKLTGVAPNVRILEIRVFDAKASSTGAEGTTDHIVRGLDAAFTGKAKVVNLSFAGPEDPLLTRMLAGLRQKGLIVVAAAGNGGPKSAPLFPGADPNVIAVTATDAGDGLYKMANQGPYIHLAAPGVDILEPAPGGSYQMTSGTSVAAAHVSGIVALMLSRDQKLTAETIESLLAATAGKLASKDGTAPGLVNAYGAIQAVDRQSSNAPIPTADATR